MVKSTFSGLTSSTRKRVSFYSPVLTGRHGPDSVGGLLLAPGAPRRSGLPIFMTIEFAFGSRRARTVLGKSDAPAPESQRHGTDSLESIIQKPAAGRAHESWTPYFSDAGSSVTHQSALIEQLPVDKTYGRH